MFVGFDRFSRGEYCTDAIFLLLLASLLMVSNDGLWSGWGGVRPTDQGSPSAFKAACDIIERTYRLTPRERDVFVLSAGGRNMAFVAESLCVTKDAVEDPQPQPLPQTGRPFPAGAHRPRGSRDRGEAEASAWTAAARV